MNITGGPKIFMSAKLFDVKKYIISVIIWPTEHLPLPKHKNSQLIASKG